MNNANYQYTLKLMLKGIEKPLILTVRQEEYERLQSNLDDPYFNSKDKKFFNFSALDGKLYSINLNHLQFVHYLWDPVEAAADRLRYEGPIEICLLNRKELIEAYTETPDEVFDFFIRLEIESEDGFGGFTDMDGELMTFQFNEIVYVSTPEEIYLEGEKMVDEEDGL